MIHKATEPFLQPPNLPGNAANLSPAKLGGAFFTHKKGLARARPLAFEIVSINLVGILGL